MVFSKKTSGYMPQNTVPPGAGPCLDKLGTDRLPVPDSVIFYRPTNGPNLSQHTMVLGRKAGGMVGVDLRQSWR